jgi:hypothetical protein
MSTFHRDLDQGKKVEDIVLAKIHEKYPLATKLEGKVKPYDIYIPELNIYVEVKSDKKSQETGNIVIEVEMYDKPSGLNSTRSDVWVIYTGIEFIYITPMRIWECVSRNMLAPAKFIGKGDDQFKKAYLVKIDQLKEYRTRGVF